MKRLLKILGIVIAILIVVAIAIPFFIDARSNGNSLRRAAMSRSVSGWL